MNKLRLTKADHAREWLAKEIRIGNFTRGATLPPEQELAALARQAGLAGNCYPDVPTAVRAAQKESLPEDFIFVGGSNFIVADLLANRDALNLH